MYRIQWQVGLNLVSMVEDRRIKSGLMSACESKTEGSTIVKDTAKLSKDVY